MTERDDGSATVYVACLAALVTLTATLTLTLGRVAVHRARAAAAADLSALAAAGSLHRGEQQACRRAAEIAVAHGAVIEHCGWAGSVVTVRVRLGVPGLGRLGSGVVRAESRAGPQA